MKPKVVIMAPFPTRSGYGAHSRDLIRCLIESEKYDISLIPLNWGNTPMNALNESNPMHKEMMKSILRSPLTEPADIFIHITIPNEFKRLGRTNIGITAGVETDRVSAEWLDAGNQMNLLIMPSEHSRNTHRNSVYDLKQSESGPTIRQIKNTAPIEVLFEGVDTDVYKPLDKDVEKVDVLSELYNIPEEFNFLYMGHWLTGNFREDRKDVGGLIYNFLTTFQYQKNNVGLILKTSGAGFSLIDREHIKTKIKDIREMVGDIESQPNIYLVHGDLKDYEVNALYNLEKVKAMITCTHGEGFGRPMAEFAAATGKPVLATGWSGQLNYLNEENSILFKYDLVPIPENVVWDKILIKDSKWANVNDADVMKKMNMVYHKYDEALEKGQKLQSFILNNRTFDQMKTQFLNLVEKYKPAVQSNIIVPQNINLPKLKKITQK